MSRCIQIIAYFGDGVKGVGKTVESGDSGEWRVVRKQWRVGEW